jgi:signal transduction histidine kinase
LRDVTKQHLNFLNIAVKRDLAPDLPKILADANQLEQVFLNLIANSRDAFTEMRKKAAAEGKEVPPGRITLLSRFVENEPTPGRAKTVEVLIRDAGCGIQQDNVARIFDLIPPRPWARGTGLGLSISYGIVKDHGREIEVAADRSSSTRLLLVCTTFWTNWRGCSAPGPTPGNCSF